MGADRIKRIMLLVLLVAASIWVAMHRGEIDVGRMEAWVRATGAWGPLVFMLLGAASAILFVPASLFVLAGGVVFGPVLGVCYSLLGATLGAAVAFFIARYIASDWVARRSRGRIKQLIEGVEAEGWHFVAFVRLVPIFPFFLLNYALGLTRIGFPSYIIATFVCSIPGVAALTYLGYVGREALGGGEALVQKVLIATVLLALMLFLPRLVRRLHDRGKL
jgi:uncharacterized membrane protein YdjX (TVP38/TMEM64 family)